MSAWDRAVMRGFDRAMEHTSTTSQLRIELPERVRTELELAGFGIADPPEPPATLSDREVAERLAALEARR